MAEKNRNCEGRLHIDQRVPKRRNLNDFIPIKEGGLTKYDVRMTMYEEKEVEAMNEKRGIKPIEILLVEDSPGDVRLAKELLKETKVLNNLHVVGDGVEAMTFLRHKGKKYANVSRPDLILLDLNLPKKDGREVLAEIKSDGKLLNIPVVILTISEAEEDILKTYNLHANCYITKPIDLDQFTKVVKSIENFWLSIVKLPPR